MEFNDLQVEKDPSSTRWILPKRELEDLGLLRWGVFGFGLFATAFTLSWISGPLIMGIGLIQGGQNFGWAIIAFAALGLTGLFFGLRILTLGYKLLRNQSRSEIIIRKNKLIATEKLGWFDWSRKVQLDSIDELVVDNGESEKREFGYAPAGTSLLVAKSDKAPFFVLIGYPEELTLEVANQLSAEIGKSVAGTKEKGFENTDLRFAKPIDHESRISVERPSSAENNNIPVTLASAEDYIPTKPSNCQIIIHEKKDGTVAYEVPPAGLLKGSKGLFAFSIIWLLFCSFIFAGILFFGPAEDGGNSWVILLVTLAFIGVGIGMLLGGIHMGKRSVMIGVLPGGLFVERKSIFGTKWLEFAQDEILNVKVGNSGMEVNDEPIKQLKIVQKNGKTVGLLSQLSEDELEWLAYSLNSSMGIDPTQTNQLSWQNEVRNMDPSDLRFPEASRIVLEESPKGIVIRVPSHYVRKGYLFMTILGLGFSAFAIGLAIWNFPDPSLSIFGAIFLVMGCLLAGVSIYLGTRRYEIRAEDDRLEIQRFWLFGSRLFAWQAKDIKSINLDSSGTKVNSETLFRLTVAAKRDDSQTPGTPKTFLNLMTWYSTLEIAIVAAILHRELKLKTIEDEGSNDRLMF